MKNNTMWLNFPLSYGYKEPLKFDNDDNTELMKTCLNEDLKGVELLLNSGVDVNVCNLQGMTALIFACYIQNENIVKLLLGRGADTNLCKFINTYNENEPMFHVLGEPVYTSYLYPSYENRMNTPLMFACAHGNIEIVKLLLDAQADVNLANTCDNTALKLASKEGYNEIVKLLLDAGAEVDFLKLQHGDGEGNYYIPDLCLKTTALINACEKQNLDIVKLLLSKNSNTNISDTNGKSPLLYACVGDNKNKEIAEILINSEITTITTKNIALAEVCKYTYTMDDEEKVMHKLFKTSKKTADENVKIIIELLITNNADYNYLAPYEDSKTPMRYAYDNDDEEIVELFLNKCADENTKYDNQITFLEHAKAYKKGWFLELLHKHHPHDPKALANILNKFSSSEKLKYTNHIWDSNLKYDDFMKNFQIEWDEIKNNLKILSESLHDDIEKFLFEEKLGQNDAQGNLISWGKGIIIGFSSPEIVEWAKNGNKPEQYPLSNPTKELKTFKDIMEEFKSMIVVKQNDKKLKLLKKFLDIKKDTKNLDFDLSDLKEDKIDKFFTDVRKLEEALKIIFDDIENISDSNKQVKIIAEEKTDFIEIQIIHLNSSSSKTAQQLLETIDKNGGNFQSIYKILTSLCDWHVDTVCSDGNRYLIDYLYPKSDDNRPHYKQIGSTNEGFTHILRFYK